MSEPMNEDQNQSKGDHPSEPKVYKPQPIRPIERWTALEADNSSSNHCFEWSLPNLFESILRTPTPGAEVVKPKARDEDSLESTTDGGSPDDPTHIRRGADSPDVVSHSPGLHSPDYLSLFTSPLCTPSPSTQWRDYHPQCDWAPHALPMVSEVSQACNATRCEDSLPFNYIRGYDPSFYSDSVPYYPYQAGDAPMTTTTRNSIPDHDARYMDSPWVQFPDRASNIYAQTSTSMGERRLSSERDDTKVETRTSYSEATRTSECEDESSEKKEKCIVGHVLQLAQTQAGSKYLQRKLARHNQMGVISTILDEVENDICIIMCDTYGNYLSAAVFQVALHPQRLRILHKIAPQLVSIACDKPGTHALQCLIGLLSTDEEHRIISDAFSQNLIELCLHPYGTHAVQHLLQCGHLSGHYGHSSMVIDRIIRHFATISNNAHGLCVLKRCISILAPGLKNNVNPVVSRLQSVLHDHLLQNAFDLAQSPFGNYAIQHTFEQWNTAALHIVKQFEGSLVHLATQKFSSNVIETVLVQFPQARSLVVQELGGGAKDLVASVYGHFVARKVISVCAGRLLAWFRSAIASNLYHISCGHLRAKWAALLIDDPYPYHAHDDELDDRHLNREQANYTGSKGWKNSEHARSSRTSWNQRGNRQW